YGSGREIARGAAEVEKCFQAFPMIDLLADDANVVLGKPPIDLCSRRGRRKRAREDAWIGGEPQEAEQDDPGQADGLLVVHRRFPPRAHALVWRCVRVHRVEQDIQVDNFHLRSASSRTISSSSSAAARASALSSETRGAPRASARSR